MLMRVHRILAGIEIFALVMWVGGLFFFGTFAARTVIQTLTNDRQTAATIIDAMVSRFNRLEVILGIAVLASNFVKMMAFGRAIRLQRFALLVSALMLVFTISYTFVLRPRMSEKRAEVESFAPGAMSPAREEYQQLHRQYEVLMGANILLGFFLVYSYRSFEERKFLALARVLK